MKPMAQTERVLRGLLRIEADKASLSKLQQGISGIVKALRTTEEAALRASEALEVLDRLTGDRGIGQAAKSMLQPLETLSQSYVSMMGVTEIASRRWIQSTERLTTAQVNLGRAATTALQPMQDQLVKIVETTSQFITQHPQLLQFAAGSAGVVLAASTALSVAVQMGEGIVAASKMIKELRNLAGFAGALGAGGILALGLPTAVVGGTLGARAIAGGLGSAGAISQNTAAAIQEQNIADVLTRYPQYLLIAIKQILEVFKRIAKLGVDFAAFIANMRLVAERGMAGFITHMLGVLGDGLGALVEAVVMAAAAIRHPFDAAKRSTFTEGTLAQLQGPGTEDILTVLGLNEDQLAEKQQGIIDGYDNLISGIETFEQSILEGAVNVEQGMEKFIRGVAGGAGGGTVGSIPLITQQMLEQYENFLYNEQLIRTANLREERKMRGVHNQELVDENAAHLKTLRDMEVAFNEQQIKAREDHIKSLEELYENYEKDELQRTEDFNDKRIRAEEDYRRNLREAARRLDAIAVLNTMQNFAIEQRRDDEDFDKETKLKKEQFEESYKQLEDNYEEVRQLAEDEHAKEIRLANEHYNKMRQQKIADFERQLLEREQENAYQMQLRSDAFQRQMLQQNFHNTYEETQMQRHYDNLRAQLEEFLGLTETGGTTTPAGGGGGATGGGGPVAFQLGGKVPYTGLFRLHEGEEVVSAPLARGYERMFGKRLSGQQLLTSGGGGLQISVGNVFNDVGGHSIKSLERMVRSATVEALTAVFKGMNA